MAAAALGCLLPVSAMHLGNEMKWGDAPPTLPKGAKLAVLQGDPGKPGPFVMRLSAPAGYKVPPHMHSQIENVTVIKGALLLGMGEKLDEKSAKSHAAGEFVAIPAKTNHYAIFKGATIVQLHGEGPFDITYVNPDDDPSKKK
ncbi:cupin domain-containing protein [Pseudoduganella sp. OTU4001]|uniref:cupin domain-containing protein n=1 Tax=Pseudoduganella sp. OTU4001 TaxID=3043854 RepID=UPI00313ADB08